MQLGPAAGGQHLDGGEPSVHLELDVEERAAPHRREDLRQRRHPEARQRSGAECVDVIRPPLHPLERGVVTDHRDAVGRSADVEFEPVTGWNGERGLECGDRVLGDGAPIAAVGEPQGSNGHLPDLEPRGDPEVVAREERRVLGVRTVEGQVCGLHPDGAPDPDVIEAGGVAIGIDPGRLDA